jgi:hypothetical protein
MFFRMPAFRLFWVGSFALFRGRLDGPSLQAEFEVLMEKTDLPETARMNLSSA